MRAGCSTRETDNKGIDEDVAPYYKEKSRSVDAVTFKVHSELLHIAGACHASRVNYIFVISVKKKRIKKHSGKHPTSELHVSLEVFSEGRAIRPENRIVILEDISTIYVSRYIIYLRKKKKTVCKTNKQTLK